MTKPFKDPNIHDKTCDLTTASESGTFDSNQRVIQHAVRQEVEHDPVDVHKIEYELVEVPYIVEKIVEIEVPEIRWDIVEEAKVEYEIEERVEYKTEIVYEEVLEEYNVVEKVPVHNIIEKIEDKVVEVPQFVTVDKVETVMVPKIVEDVQDVHYDVIEYVTKTIEVPEYVEIYTPVIIEKEVERVEYVYKEVFKEVEVPEYHYVDDVREVPVPAPPDIHQINKTEEYVEWEERQQEYEETHIKVKEGSGTQEVICDVPGAQLIPQIQPFTVPVEDDIDDYLVEFGDVGLFTYSDFLLFYPAYKNELNNKIEQRRKDHSTS